MRSGVPFSEQLHCAIAAVRPKKSLPDGALAVDPSEPRSLLHPPIFLYPSAMQNLGWDAEKTAPATGGILSAFKLRIYSGVPFAPPRPLMTRSRHA